ncbi:aminoglycoside phosphotransferase family protein [Bacillus carboniphilus]|uniref:Aminoglycoside phosphotransferase family protein n=1 Tax=Bacillus carboniphilus TaxID=86663 RepID=A0ABY9JSI5_9BACI|nr:aminoglycoside phosphotransferase family protein [Bacillus carboniphilus]WLR42312.1 aminoglycoside phosphotransferase family protein [Bacillus carboniphilus]
MGDISYKLDFKDICRTSLLGELVNEPKPISGGLLHRMFSVETTQGKYAVKLLNPEIMKRPNALRNYVNAEKIAYFLSKNIPALSTRNTTDDFIQNVNGQYYLVFNWIEGVTLNQVNINNSHCEKIGGILADIHKTDFSELKITNDKHENNHLINWDYYLQRGKKQYMEWVDILSLNFDNLKGWNLAANEAEDVLASNMVISHRDLDSKNVMWNFDKPVLIDWESAGFINPHHDLVETAIYWSTKEKGEIDKQKFCTFIQSYQTRYGQVNADWRKVLSLGFLGKLDWLEYSLKRSLGIECTDEEDKKMGTEQVTATINEIRSYADQIPILLNWLKNEL